MNKKFCAALYKLPEYNQSVFTNIKYRQMPWIFYFLLVTNNWLTLHFTMCKTEGALQYPEDKSKYILKI